MKMQEARKESLPSPYEGMTVNERLFAAQLLDSWDRTAKARKRDKMIEILIAVHFSSQSAEQIVDAVLVAPKFYGF